MNYNSVVTIESKIAPGVRYGFHKANPQRQSVLALAVAEPRQKLEQVLAEGKRIAAQPVAERDAARLRALVNMADALISILNAAFVGAALAGIEGLTINGKPATPQSFLADAPAELFQEAFRYASAAMTLESLPPVPALPGPLVN